MTAFHPVTVQRLELKGDTRQREALLAGLDDSDWPAADDSRYLIVRHLRVEAPWWQAAEHAGRGAQALAAGAVSGWSPLAAEAPAVRFASLADLLACLSRDMANGVAATRWYWQGWQRFLSGMPGPAITELWVEHIQELPEVLEQLLHRQAARAVLTRLDAPEVAHLMARARAVTGWPLPATVAAAGGPPAPGHRDGTPDVSSLVPTWRAALATLPARQVRALIPLIALVTGWTVQPHRMHQAQPWRQWCHAIEAAMQAVTSDRSPDDGGRPAIPHATSGMPSAPPNDTWLQRRPRLSSQPPTPSRPGATRSGQPGAALPRQRSTRGAAMAETCSPPPPDQSSVSTSGSLGDGTRHPPVPPAVPQPAPQPTPLGAAPADDPGAAIDTRLSPTDQTEESPTPRQFHTNQGGLFYLLNVLAHPVLARLLEAGHEPGWQRLYRLGLHLGLAADGDLRRFLAARLQLADVSELNDVTALQDEPRILAQADRLYGHLPCWGPELLDVPATVSHSRSRLDVYYPLDAVRLDVRRAGLDIDPGWLPWLGLVVRFHYRAQPMEQEPPRE